MNYLAKVNQLYTLFDRFIQFKDDSNQYFEDESLTNIFTSIRNTYIVSSNLDVSTFNDTAHRDFPAGKFF